MIEKKLVSLNRISVGFFKKKNVISLSVIFLIHLHCIFDSFTSPSPMVSREKHSFKTAGLPFKKY